MQGRGHLNLAEFMHAIFDLLRSLQVSAEELPNEKQLSAMFDKHSVPVLRSDKHSNEKGISREAYEDLLFRLLCFLLASGQFSVEQGKRASTGGEQRDRRWREEFLKQNDQRIGDVYEFGSKLGEGTFGAVYGVAHRTELSGTSRRERVCKVISKASTGAKGCSHDRVREEFAVLKKLDHPHVLRIFEHFEDGANFYIVMEPCRGGDLHEAIKSPFTRDAAAWEKWVAKVMQHTLEAIAYCHTKGVIHKDLKPENVMMSSPKGSPVEDVHVIVVDFGLAQIFSGPKGRSHEIAGTPPFMAPEVWAGNFGKGCDVWASGVMLFFMLSGSYPFRAARIQDFPQAVAKEPNWQEIGNASPHAQYICWHMLCKSEGHRPSAQSLLDNEWFKFHGLASEGQSAVLLNMGQDLLNIRERSHFEKFVGRLVATQLDAGQLKQVNEAFRAFDADNDGTLSCNELCRGLVMLGATLEEARKVAQDLDVGQTGRISYTEFLAGVTDLSRKSSQERDELLWLAWLQFKPDKSGQVTTNNIQSALAARGMTVAEMPHSFMQQLRRDASGTMNFEEFKGMFEHGDQACTIMSSMVARGPAA